jgi:hypothetical protein
VTLGWTDPAFLAAADAWIRSHVEVTGPIEQTHVQVWSTVLRISTADGTMWFKAPQTRSEAPLTRLLARIRPEAVPEVLVTDDARGWMLLRDAGTRLRELLDGDRDLRHRERVLASCGDLQVAAAPHADAIEALGVPAFRLADLADRVADLLEADEFLLLGEPDGVTHAERAALRARIPDIAGMCRDLAASGIPETIQHDDLNDGNVFVADGRYRIVDWGDACISHPFHTLTVALRATAYRLGLEPGGPDILRLRDAYLEPFAAFGTREELAGVAETAYRTGTLARALAWRAYVADRPAEDRMPDLESVPYGLKVFLEAGPLGTWETR